MNVMPKYNRSYSEEENQLVYNFFQTATDKELAEMIDNLCRELYSTQDSDFPAYYEKQLKRLREKEELSAEITNMKKEISYNEQKQRYDAFQKLRPLLLEEYKKRNRGKGVFSRDTFYNNFANKVVEKHSDETGVAFITFKEMKRIMVRPGGKTAYEEPVKPNPDTISFTDIEILEKLGTPLLRHFLEVLIYYLDADDISNVYVEWLFIVASQLAREAPHHDKKEHPTHANRMDIIKLKKEYNELLMTLDEQ